MVIVAAIRKIRVDHYRLCAIYTDSIEPASAVVHEFSAIWSPVRCFGMLVRLPHRSPLTRVDVHRFQGAFYDALACHFLGSQCHACEIHRGARLLVMRTYYEPGIG